MLSKKVGEETELKAESEPVLHESEWKTGVSNSKHKNKHQDTRRKEDSKQRSKKKEKDNKKNRFYRPFRLCSKINETHDTIRYRFSIPNEIHFSEYGIISTSVKFAAIPHEKDRDIMSETDIKKKSKNKVLTRSYTFVNDLLDLSKTNEIEFIIKLYENGSMSNYLKNNLNNEGDIIYISNPKIKINYDFIKNKKHIIMIAGGTGIAPMIQILKQICLDINDTNNNISIESIDLFYSNKTCNDAFLCQNDIQHSADILLTSIRNVKFRWFNLITRENKIESQNNNKYNKYNMFGQRLTKEMLANYIAKPSDDVLILVCGTKPMCKTVCKEYLPSLGYSQNMMYKF